MVISYEGKNMRLPDFLIPGAAGSGTTAVYEHLRSHPNIFMPIEKEPMFLSLWNIGKQKEWHGVTLVDDWMIPNLKNYTELFRKAKKVASLIYSPIFLKSGVKCMVPPLCRHKTKMSAMKQLLTQEPLPKRSGNALPAVYEKEIQALETILGRSPDVWRDQKYKVAVPE